MKRPISYLLVGIIVAALVIGVLGAAVSAVTSTGLQSTSTGGSGTDPTGTTTMTTTEAYPSETTTATATTTTAASGEGGSGQGTSTPTATATMTSGQGSSGSTTGSGHQFFPFTGTPYPVPGKIEAENYDVGPCNQAGSGQGGSGTGTTTPTATAMTTSTVTATPTETTSGGGSSGNATTTPTTTATTTTSGEGGSGNGTPTATMTTAATTTTATTTTSGQGSSGQGSSGNATGAANITLLAPNATSVISGEMVTVMTRVSNFTLVDPATVNDTPAAGQGHIHYFLDAVPPTTPGVPARTGIAGEVLETPNTTIRWANVTAGTHTFYAMLVNNDHTPYSPIAMDSVTFQVNATNASGTSGMGTGTVTTTTTATSGNGTSGQGSGNATSGTTIALVAPNATSAIDGRLVNVATEVSNFTLVDPDMVNLTPAAGQGHIHYFLDAVPPTTPGVPADTGIGNTVFETPNTEIQWANVTPGMHTLYAMLVNNDHTPVIPIVVDSVSFQVNQTSSTGTGTGTSNVTETTVTTGMMTGTPTINGTGAGNSSTIYGTGTGVAGAVVMAIINAITGSSAQDQYGTATGTMTATPTETTSGQGSSGQGSTGNQTIVQIAQADSNFSTLVTALQTAGLVETLNGTGPFTVFAPTNAAFDALPSGTLNALLANTTDLTRVLTYHVVSGNFPAAQVVSMTSLTTVEGQPLNVTVQAGGSVRVDGANITRTDIQASNGVIHVIDAVMIPPNTTSGEGGSGTGTVTPTVTATATATTTTTTTTSGQGTSGQGGAGQSTSGQPGAAPGQYGCGQGWAYFDRTPGNQGGVYRQDDVDIENGGTGHVVAFVKSSEWLIYSVHVPENGMYRATFSASSPWNDREIWVWVDGILEAQVKVPNTGSFDAYQDTSADIALPVGNHYIRLEFVRDAQNLDFMTFERVGDIPTWPFFGAGTSSQGTGSSSGGQVTGTATTATTHTTSTEGTSGQGSSGQGTSTATATPTATMTSEEGTAMTTATTMATTATMGEGSSGEGTSTPTVTATTTVTSDEGSSDQDTTTPTITATPTMTSGEGSSGQGTGTMTACPTETVSGQNTSGA